MKIETIGLLGFGRFGRMVLEYLSPAKLVRVYDTDPQKLEGLAQAASFEPTISSQVIILCVPISSLEEACRKMAPHLRPGQIVVDTCSVKERPLRWMLAHLPKSVEILGTHPLFGPDSGKDGIAGLKIVLCPARIRDEAYSAIRHCLESLQLVLIETTPAEHDRQIAQSQAIFHLIAQVVKRLTWGGQAISTPGPEMFYRLVRTVQHDTDQLFLDMERENPHALQYRRQFIQEMIRLDEELSARN